MRSFVPLGIALLLVAGCGKDDVERARERMSQQPSVSPGHGGETPAPAAGTAAGQTATPPGAGDGMAGMSNAGAPTDGQAMPLKQSGTSGAAELRREVAKLHDPGVAASFERAFRLSFTTDTKQRNYGEARTLLLDVLQKLPDFAPAYRTLGYAEFNLGNGEGAMQDYQRAVAIDPNYGEAHYAIAFLMAATGELDQGVEHYRKAMQLGVADERKIGEKFYKDRLKTQ